MIVAMKKVLLLALAADKDATLAALRQLGVMEVTAETVADTVDRQKTAAQLGRLDRLIGILSSRPATPSRELPGGRELYQLADERQNDWEAIVKEQDHLRKTREQLKDWGHFQWLSLRELERKGIRIQLCEAPKEQYAALIQSLGDGIAAVPVHNAGGMVKFAVIAQPGAGLNPETLPLAVVPETTLDETDAGLERCRKGREKLDGELNRIAGRLPELRDYRARLANEVDFLLARDALADYGEIVALRGFVPAPEAEALRQQAHQQGWGLILSDPEPDEAVPVLLRPPRWARPIMPLLSFLGISPSYHEFDLSPGLLIFFSIFFSMIINDAGYGLLILAGSIVAAVLLRHRPKARLTCQLALILSACSVAWGVVNGSYFGIECAPLSFFASGPNQTANLELICFVLALVHLSLGRCWRLVNASSFREILGQLGWLPILQLDFMVVYKLLIAPGAIPAWSLWLAGFGLALVLIGDIDWRNISAICNFPFDLIGSFTDTLSYVRLFAVGMSGTYMALSFNSMAMDIWNISPWLIPVAIIIMLLGHALNVALAFMGVLVHGVRLNTLEFSNHANIRWGGRTFRPLEEYRS